MRCHVNIYLARMDCLGVERRIRRNREAPADSGERRIEVPARTATGNQHCGQSDFGTDRGKPPKDTTYNEKHDSQSEQANPNECWDRSEKRVVSARNHLGD
jgi:hypothetical protein